MQYYELNSLKENETAVVQGISAAHPLFRRFTDLGVTAGTRITCTRRRGGTAAYRIRQTVIVLRDRDAAGIQIGQSAEGTADD